MSVQATKRATTRLVLEIVQLGNADSVYWTSHSSTFTDGFFGLFLPALLLSLCFAWYPNPATVAGCEIYHPTHS